MILCLLLNTGLNLRSLKLDIKYNSNNTMSLMYTNVYANYKYSCTQQEIVFPLKFDYQFLPMDKYFK